MENEPPFIEINLYNFFLQDMIFLVILHTKELKQNCRKSIDQKIFFYIFFIHFNIKYFANFLEIIFKHVQVN